MEISEISETMSYDEMDLPVLLLVTQEGEHHCVATHLIPHSKGDEVRFVVCSYNHLMTLFSSTLQK